MAGADCGVVLFIMALKPLTCPFCWTRRSSLGVCGELTLLNGFFLVADFDIGGPAPQARRSAIEMITLSRKRVSTVGARHEGHHFFERRDVELCARSGTV